MKEETKVISISNKKGGVGKSVTVSGIASVSAHFGAKVLIVDVDPQINTTSLFCKRDTEKTIADLITVSEESLSYDYVKECIYPSDYDNIDIIPGDENLDDIGDIILVKNSIVEESHDNNGKDVLVTNKQAKLILRKSIDMIKEDYDLILIDNTPYFNLISKNALSASNCVLIPVENDGFSYSGLAKLLYKINQVKGELNESLDIIGVFFTCVNNRTRLFQQLKGLFESEIGDTMLQTYIRQDNQVKESVTALQPLYDYAHHGKATQDYMKLILELEILEESKLKAISDELIKNEKRGWN